jgi:antitoxin FitA
MASLTIRNLDERVKQNLRMRAAARGISMEEEARQALTAIPEMIQNTQNEATKSETVRKRMTVAELMAWIDSLPKGKPTDPRYETLDHKTLTDLIWEGEL